MATGKVNIDDSVLIEQCRRGDAGALERLILKYQNRIYNVVLKICGNCDDAAELTQETFVKVIENIERFQGRSSFYTWAFRIAVNLSLNHCKRNVKLAAASLDGRAGTGQGGQQALREFLSDESAPDPERYAQDRELAEMAVKALMKMSDEQRTIVVLRDIEGMSYAQIARVLNVHLGTVRSRLSRARSNLREIMEGLLQ